MKTKYQNLISNLVPYCVLAPGHNLNLNRNILGMQLDQNNIFNPLLTSSRDFIEKIYKMDELTFGDQGMQMEKWVFFDCSVMPGFVFGFAVKGSDLDIEDRTLLGIKENEIFPVSMYIAIPMLERAAWFGHNLSSLNGKLRKNLSGLGLLTKAIALELFQIKKLYGATQWDSRALLIHRKLGRMELQSSFTPIHSKNNTLCYKSEPFDLIDVVSERQIIDESGTLFDPSIENIFKIQKRIENKEKFEIKKVYFYEGKLQIYL